MIDVVARLTLVVIVMRVTPGPVLSGDIIPGRCSGTTMLREGNTTIRDFLAMNSEKTRFKTVAIGVYPSSFIIGNIITSFLWDHRVRIIARRARAESPCVPHSIRTCIGVRANWC